jgi:hypothetical protein
VVVFEDLSKTKNPVSNETGFIKKATFDLKRRKPNGLQV